MYHIKNDLADNKLSMAGGLNNGLFQVALGTDVGQVLNLHQVQLHYFHENEVRNHFETNILMK